jgi:hypothetical protein
MACCLYWQVTQQDAKNQDDCLGSSSTLVTVLSNKMRGERSSHELQYSFFTIRLFSHPRRTLFNEVIVIGRGAHTFVIRRGSHIF